MPFAMLCQSWGRYIRTQARIDRLEREDRTDGLDFRRQVMIASKHFQEVTALAGRFGLTASDRARLHLPEEKPADPFADFLSVGKEGTNG